MADSDSFYLLLNGEKMYLHSIGKHPTPVRINKKTADDIQRAINRIEATPTSCVHSMSTRWEYNSFCVDIKFNARTQCINNNLYTTSARIKTPICCDSVCRGKCKDHIMQDTIARNILPDLYQDKQR